jgi:hypothetical protein
VVTPFNTISAYLYFQYDGGRRVFDRLKVELESRVRSNPDDTEAALLYAELDEMTYQTFAINSNFSKV